MFKKIIKLNLFIVGITLMANTGCAEENYSDLFSNIIKDCSNSKWTDCDKHFIGEKRGAFHLVIENIRAEEAKKDFIEFIGAKYGEKDISYFTVSNLTLGIDTTINYQNIDKLISKTTKINANKIAIFLGEDELYLKKLKSKWKIEIPDKSQEEFQSTKDFTLSKGLRFYANVLNFYRILGTQKDISKEQFKELFNRDVIVLTYNFHTDESKNRLLPYIKEVNGQNIARFYWPLVNDKKIQESIDKLE
jgi:hypothetical protein